MTKYMPLFRGTLPTMISRIRVLCSHACVSTLTWGHSRRWGVVEAHIVCSASEASHSPYRWGRPAGAESYHPPVDPATSARWRESSTPRGERWPCQRKDGHCYAWLTTPWRGCQMIWEKQADHRLERKHVQALLNQCWLIPIKAKWCCNGAL